MSMNPLLDSAAFFTLIHGFSNTQKHSCVAALGWKTSLIHREWCSSSCHIHLPSPSWWGLLRIIILTLCRAGQRNVFINLVIGGGSDRSDSRLLSHSAFFCTESPSRKWSFINSHVEVVVMFHMFMNTTWLAFFPPFPPKEFPPYGEKKSLLIFIQLWFIVWKANLIWKVAYLAHFGLTLSWALQNKSMLPTHGFPIVCWPFSLHMVAVQTTESVTLHSGQYVKYLPSPPCANPPSAPSGFYDLMWFIVCSLNKLIHRYPITALIFSLSFCSGVFFFFRVPCGDACAFFIHPFKRI